MTTADSYRVLGLQRSDRPSRSDIKRAFRELALQHHPDLNQGANAAKEFDRIRLAAEILLGQHEPAQASSSRTAGSAYWQHFSFARSPRFPLYFCAACLCGGCMIFAGALSVHQDLYTYSVHQEAEERRLTPTEGQRRIKELLQQQREQRQAPAQPHHDGSQ